MFGRKVRFHLSGKDIRGMRRTKSSSLKQKRANKHLRGIKKYTLSNEQLNEQSNEQKSFDYVSTSDMLFATNVRYRIFIILGGISVFILLALVPINLFLGFIAYVIVNLVNMNSNFFQLVGVKDVSFMTVFESFYLGNVEFMRVVFVTICVATIVFSLSLYVMWVTEKKTDITSLKNQYYGKIRKEK